MTPQQVSLAGALLRRLTLLETARAYAREGKAALVCSRGRESYVDRQEIDLTTGAALVILDTQVRDAKAQLRELGVEIE